MSKPPSYTEHNPNKVCSTCCFSSYEMATHTLRCMYGYKKGSESKVFIQDRDVSETGTCDQWGKINDT